MGDEASGDLPLDETVGRQIHIDLIEGDIQMTHLIVYSHADGMSFN
jgi:hypothetical protein